VLFLLTTVFEIVFKRAYEVQLDWTKKAVMNTLAVRRARGICIHVGYGRLRNTVRAAFWVCGLSKCSLESVLLRIILGG
jgi:hypothetical protein